MNEKICQTCVHFLQHFAKRKSSYVPVDCGHCIYPRVKPRKPETLGCKYYKEKIEEEEIF